MIKKYKTTLLLSSIIIYALLLYFQILSHDFINWDDYKYVKDNPLIQDFSLAGFKKIFTSLYFNGYLPLTIFSFAIDHFFWGLDPKGYHLTNLVLHLLNIILVFRLTSLLSKKVIVSSVVALLFAIHPMRIESVAWVSERKDVLYVFFFLLGLITYVRYIDSKQWKYYSIAAFCLALSFLAKHAAITFPAVLFVFDLYRNRTLNKGLFFEKIPFILLPVGLFSINFMLGSVVADTFPFVDRLFLGSYGLTFYLVKFLAPLNLSGVIPFPQKINSILPVEYYWSMASSILLVGLMFWTVLKVKRLSNIFMFGFLFFLVNISTVLHVVTSIGGHVVVADRYTYLAYFGLFFIVGELLDLLSNTTHVTWRKLKPILYLVAGGYFVAFSVGTIKRINVWENSLTFFNDVIKKDSSVAFAYNNRGLYYIDKNQNQKAYDDFEDGIRLKPANNILGDLYYNRGTLNQDLFKLEVAIKDFDRAILLDNRHAAAYNNRGLAKSDLGLYREAILDFNTSLSFDPNLALAYCNRGWTNFQLGENIALVLKDLNKSITLNPKLDLAYNNRGWVLASMNKYKEAIRDYSKAIQINRQFEEALNNRGWAYVSIENYESAVNDFSSAILVKPDFILAYNNRAWAKYNLHQYRAAIADYDQVISIDPQSSHPYHNKALIYEVLGELELACRFFKIAADLGNDASEIKYGDLCL